jgi:hypothetical protein
VNLLQPPDFTGKKQLWEISGPSKNYGKKGSNNILEILNPYGENPYGKNGDRRAV